ncbi:MAG: hypothetical protein J6S14_08015 [Clostridia bacterium]|nr:hypothetical protein [Clostridia bacterium]
MKEKRELLDKIGTEEKVPGLNSKLRLANNKGFPTSYTGLTVNSLRKAPVGCEKSNVKLVVKKCYFCYNENEQFCFQIKVKGEFYDNRSENSKTTNRC